MAKRSAKLETNNVQEEISEIKTVSAQLRHAREEKKLTIDDVASQLRISKFRIRQLEDDSAPLMCDVYTRGFIRNYSEFLGLSADPLLEQHESLCSLKQDQEPKVEIAHMTRTSSPGWGAMVFSCVLVCAVAGAIVYTYQGQHESSSPSAEAPVHVANVTHQWLRSSEPVWVEVETTAGVQLSNHIMEANETYPLPDNEDVVLSTDNLGALRLVSGDSEPQVLGAPGERVYNYKISNAAHTKDY